MKSALFSSALESERSNFKLFPLFSFTRYLTKWHVCSNGEAVECSKTKYDHVLPDHLMGKYLDKVKILNSYPDKKKKFISDQCKDS